MTNIFFIYSIMNLVIKVIKFFSIKKDFYDFYKKHSKLLENESISKKQLDLMIDTVDMDLLYKSAKSYFGQYVYCNQNSLILNDKIQNKKYKIICKNKYIVIDSIENPFINILKRKYNYYFIIINE